MGFFPSFHFRLHFIVNGHTVVNQEFCISFHKGRYLLDFVFNYLDLLETDYFGLRYIDQQKQRLHEEITRYYLFLQLRRDLLHGRLYCVQNDAAILAAYIIQGDHGEASTTEDQDSSYISDYKILLKQTPKVEEKIAEIHKSLSGLSPAMAELYFLKKASTLDTYGVDPYSVKDHRGLHLYLGLSHAGILTFQGSKRMHHFRWSEVQKLNYEGKMFIIHLIFMEVKLHYFISFSNCMWRNWTRSLFRIYIIQSIFIVNL
ncbi:FERM domain-containing protein 5 [Armadillidium vulgare]|nr:FERM domain-containing protein 5 [Armadillidium vulgare]